MARKNNPDRPKPWAALGISESTYYRRKRNGVLDITPSLTAVQPAKTVKKTVKAKTVTVKAAKTVKKSAVIATKTVKSDSDSDRSISNDSEKTEKPWLIKPGEVRNPAGRPKGSRNKLTEAFITAMCQDFEVFGMEAIVATRTSKPEAYLAACTKIIPAQVEVGEAGAFDGMSDDELDALLVQRMASLQRHQAERSAYLQ